MGSDHQVTFVDSAGNLLVLSFLLHFSVRWGGVHFHCFCQPIWCDQMVLHQPHWPPHDLETWSETKSATWGKVLGGFRPFSLPLFKHEVLVLAKLSKRDVALLSEAAASLGVGRRPDDHVILLVRKREDEQTRWPRGGLPSGLAVAFSGVLTNVRGQNGLIGSLGVQGHLKFLNMFLNTFPLINPPFGETSVFFFNFCVPPKASPRSRTSLLAYGHLYHRYKVDSKWGKETLLIWGRENISLLICGWDKTWQDLAPANRMGMGIRTQSWTAMPPKSGCFTKHGHFLDFLDESKRSLQWVSSANHLGKTWCDQHPIWALIWISWVFPFPKVLTSSSKHVQYLKQTYFK